VLGDIRRSIDFVATTPKLIRPVDTKSTNLAASKWKKRLIVPIVACCLINATIVLGTWCGNPNYLWDYRLATNPDAVHYVLEGRNSILRHHFSRCTSEPYVADMLRTPVYPLFAGAIDLLTGSAGIFLAQIALQILSCVLVFVLGCRLISPAAGWLAATLLGTDLMLAISNFEAMSEVVFMFLTLAAILCVVPAKSSSGSSPSIRRCLFSGLLLGIATLTRPAGLYLPLLNTAVLVAWGFWNRQLTHGVVSSVAMLLAFLIPVALWIGRNEVVFGLPRLTTADAIMTVYFAGAGAYQIEHNISLEQAQKRIASEYDLPPPQVTNNHWVSSMPVKEMDHRLRAVQSDVLLKYPVALVKSSLLGILKAHISHNVATLGYTWGIPWNQSGRADSSTGNRLERLLSNHLLLIAALAWQLIHTLVTWTLFVIGLPLLFRLRRDWPFLIMLGALAYFFLTVGLVGADAYCRSRTPHMPFVFVIAGAAAKWFDNKDK
jgi:Dolichyl-phosphate-mannose-protein mannosyltransferase